MDRPRNPKLTATTSSAEVKSAFPEHDVLIHFISPFVFRQVIRPFACQVIPARNPDNSIIQLISVDQLQAPFIIGDAAAKIEDAATERNDEQSHQNQISYSFHKHNPFILVIEVAQQKLLRRLQQPARMLTVRHKRLKLLFRHPLRIQCCHCSQDLSL